jgi:hypothetical protein
MERDDLQDLSFIMTAIILAMLNVGSRGVCAKDKREDLEEIGNRDVSKGTNFYSIQKEIALGRMMAEELERQAANELPLR